MKYRFTVYEELDTPVSIAVGAYLDCEHYIYLHNSLSHKVDILEHIGRRVTVKQSWKWFGITFSHIKTGEYLPPNEFKIYNVRPYPAWVPSIHHLIKIDTHLIYREIAETNSTLMVFHVELDLPFFLWPFRNFLRRMIEEMHAEQNRQDMVMIKYRARLFGRDNNDAYLAPHQFLYHKDDYVKHFGKPSKPVHDYQQKDASPELTPLQH